MEEIALCRSLRPQPLPPEAAGGALGGSALLRAERKVCGEGARVGGPADGVAQLLLAEEALGLSAAAAGAALPASLALMSANARLGCWAAAALLPSLPAAAAAGPSTGFRGLGRCARRIGLPKPLPSDSAPWE